MTLSALVCRLIGHRRRLVILDGGRVCWRCFRCLDTQPGAVSR